MQNLLLIILATIFITSCAMTKKEVKKRNNDYAEKESNKIKKLASFDLNCPKNKLKIKVLDKDLGESGYIKDFVYWKQVGVSGCGKKIRYINVDLNVGEWIANSSGKKK